MTFIIATSLAAAGYGIVVLPDQPAGEPAGRHLQAAERLSKSRRTWSAYREREKLSAVRAFLAVAKACIE